uniref:CRAL-TRIO domain-containing protein n=1 Tax=Syphacia muris TaxID=451379 RepID=A0A0N5AUT5_9BILA
MEEIHGGRLKAEDILHVLRDHVAELPGTRDRESRPVIVFPARETSTPLIPDHIRNILIYLHTVTSDECKEHGFVFIIDMRRGTTWSHDHFPASVHIVLIIKPDNFWEKHKTSASSGKYKFEVQMISVENLTKFIEPSQLTREFGGTLFYDHDEWLEMRLELEKLIWRMIDARENFEAYRKEIENAALPVDVATAEQATNAHIALKKKIVSAPIDSLQIEVQKIIQRISGSSFVIKENGFNLSNNYASANPDLAATLPHLSLLIERLRLLKEEIFTKWEIRRQQLDHCYQLKLFEQDAEKMFEWICTHFTLFTQKFLEIGDSKQATELLIAEHREFEKIADNTEVNVSHVMTVAKRLQEVGNYGKAEIEKMAVRLEEEWQRFKSAVNSRTKLLELALAFHQKSSIYLNNYNHWLEVVDEGNNLRHRTADELENAIAEHKRFGENFVQIYAEAVGNGRALTHRLKCMGSEAGVQNESLILIEDIIQKITHAQKQLYGQWESQRLKLHSRLALIAFETDTHLVLQWLEQHGDAYLSKNTAVGLNLSQAKALQRNHSHFRSVAANTYSNANKLFTASKTIIETGEGDARQMGTVVEELRRRIEQFSAKVEARRLLLDKSVLFQTHHYEMIQWYNSMEAKANMYEKVSLNVKDGEHLKEEWNAECEATTQAYFAFAAYNTTKNEGLQLVKALEQQARTLNIDNRETIDVIEGLVSEIEQRHVRLLETWPRQKQALQLAVRFAVFINECKQIIQQLKNWQDDMTSLMRSENLAERAERILPYQEENTEQVESAVCKIKEAAIQLNKDLESSEIRLSDVEGVLASTLVRRSEEQLLYCKNEVMKVAYETRLRIERCMQLSRARALAQQAIETMGREELNLIRTNVIPTNLDEALEAQIAHDKFQVAMKKTHLIISDFVEKTDQLMKAGSIDPAAVSVLNEQVCSKWIRLLGLNEERNKLIKAAVGCYKTFHQAVLPILDQLEKDYSIGALKDWCKEPVDDRVAYIALLLSKHGEYKERFLKGCSYAQKTSELFLKYIRRCDSQGPTTSESISAHESRILKMKTDLREKQQKILDLWSKQKKQLDCCQATVFLEATVEKIISWIDKNGETFLKKSGSWQLVGVKKGQIDSEIESCNTFMVEVKEQRAKVRMVLELAQANISDGILDELHGKEIQKCMESVRSRFEVFCSRLNEYENSLLSALGRKSEINKTGIFMK